MDKRERETSLRVSQRLIATRTLMNRYWMMEMSRAGNDTPGFGQDLARWLASQLPASDSGRMGWGLIAVAAMLYPPWYDPVLGDIDKRKPPGWPPGRSKGCSIALLMACRVGEALIGTGNPSAASPAVVLEVGGELAALDFGQLMAEQGLGLADRLGDHQAETDRGMVEIREALLPGLPGADLRAIGWALVGTAVVVMRETLTTQVRGRRGRRAQWRAYLRDGSAIGAFMLSTTGQALTREPGPG